MKPHKQQHETSILATKYLHVANLCVIFYVLPMLNIVKTQGGTEDVNN